MFHLKVKESESHKNNRFLFLFFLVSLVCGWVYTRNSFLHLKNVPFYIFQFRKLLLLIGFLFFLSLEVPPKITVGVTVISPILLRSSGTQISKGNNVAQTHWLISNTTASKLGARMPLKLAQVRIKIF